MSASEVASQTHNNAESAQDVQNMLAELKGSSNPEVVTESAAAENEVATQANTEVDSLKDSKTNDSDEKNGIKGLETKNGADSKEEKDGDSAKGENGEQSKDQRSHRGGGRGRGRGRGRGDYKSYKQNIKSDLTAQEETDDPVQIRKQVEFYFSDSNLPMDKFLLSQVGGSKNYPVDLKIIHSFKRMRHFQPFAAIPAALKESKFLELTDDDTKVKRKEPLPEKIDPEEMDPDSIKVFEDRFMPRSVYVKGFGEEDSKTQLDIESFFAPYGPYNAIRLRRAHDKVFKGSVFVEFDSEETQKKFLELDPKPKYQGKDLQIMSKKEYCEKKVDDIKSGKVKASGHRGRGGFHNKRKRDDEDDRDWRERREDDRKNGFDKSRRGGRGGRGGRDSRRDQEREIQRDARGVPIIESTAPSKDDDKKSSQAKREAATADALAKAKAMVQAEKAKSEANPERESESENKKEDPEADPAAAKRKSEAQLKPDLVNDAAENPVAAAAIEQAGPSTSKKRGRDDADDEAGAQPGTKRVDSKAEAGADGKEVMES